MLMSQSTRRLDGRMRAVAGGVVLKQVVVQVESASRFGETKRVVPRKDIGPLVAAEEMSRCIHCTRCVRFTAEIAGEMELGQAFRGEHAEIMPFIEKTIDSELSGNIIDLCPVGALTSKPFRFAARTWELSRRKSVSPHDSLGSNLIVQTKHDVVKRVLPLENEEINECWLSDKDRFSYEGLASEERLTVPLVRQGGQWKRVDWQTALEFVATGLRGIARDHGPAAIGALGSPHSTLEELYLLQKLVRGLGSENVDFRLRQADFRADGKRAGAPWLGMPIAGVKDLTRLLVVGSFLRKDAPLLAQRVRQAAKKGLHVSAIGPNAEEWLVPVRNRALVAPSEMVATLAQVVVALAREKGAEVSVALLGKLPETVSDEALAIAQSLASGRQVAVWLGSLAAQHSRASELQMLAQEIARLTDGSFGFIGEAANSVGGYLAGAVPGEGGLNAAAMIEQPRKAYLLLNLEPDLDLANPAAAMAALDPAQLVVALSCFDSVALRQVADVLLPVAPFTETSGSFVNAEGRARGRTETAGPTAGPTLDLSIPRLYNITMSSAVGADDCPTNPSNSFTTATTEIYVTARAANLGPGSTIVSRWLLEGAEVVNYDWSPSFEIADACIWFYITPSAVEFTPGSWSVELLLDGAPAADPVGFTITSAG